MQTVWKDIRYGLRQLRGSPAFTAIAVLSLALGIGANTAIFQLVNAVRLRSLPVADPQDLAYLDFARGSTRSGSFSTRSSRFTYAHWEQLQKYQEPFTGIIAWSARRFNLSAGGEVRYAEGQFVSSRFFDVLGVKPVLGRTFAAEDDKPGCGSPAAVIGYAFWQREFAGDPQITSRTVTLEGRSFPILGVTPASFFGVEVGQQYDVAIPLCADALLADDGKGRAPIRRAWWISAMGRLKPGWTPQRATTYLQTVAPRIMEATLPPTYRPDQAKRYLANKLEATSGATGVSGLRRQYEGPLGILLAITGLVLLIACANLANLLLARASVREREIAVRQAIGASRGRLIRQLLMESLLLSVIGTAAGVVLAQILSRSLVAFLSTSNNSLFVGLGMDWRVLGFTSGVAVLSCLLFGLFPALRATRVAPASVMRAAGRGLTSGREKFSARRFLVVAQVAMSLVLLTGAMLFVGSLQKLLRVDPGFRAEGLISVELDMQRLNLAPEARPAALRQYHEKLSSVPGVVSTAQIAFTAVSGSGWNESAWADGGDGKHQNSFFNRAGAGYFKTMGTGLVAGREFDERDSLHSTKVAVVNETFVKKFFGTVNPIGRNFRVEGNAGQSDPVYQVVGIVRDTKYYEIREDFLPIAFLPMSQEERPGSGGTWVLRTQVPAGEIFRSVKAAMAAIHPNIQIEFRIMSQQLEESLMRDRLMATLAGAFGLLAGLLSTLGLYGVIAYMVARRRNEIGIRMALGADRLGVIRLVLKEAALLLAIGLAVGIGLTLWAGKTAASLLFGLKPNEPAVVAGACALLAAVALLASFIPAQRAARLDPMNALREE